MTYDSASSQWRWTDGSELTWDPWQSGLHGPSEPACTENCCATIRRTGPHGGKLFAQRCDQQSDSAKILCNSCLDSVSGGGGSQDEASRPGELKNDALENLVGGLYGECLYFLFGPAANVGSVSDLLLHLGGSVLEIKSRNGPILLGYTQKLFLAYSDKTSFRRVSIIARTLMMDSIFFLLFLSIPAFISLRLTVYISG